jgi:hypothetical protein
MKLITHLHLVLRLRHDEKYLHSSMSPRACRGTHLPLAQEMRKKHVSIKNFIETEKVPVFIQSEKSTEITI